MMNSTFRSLAFVALAVLVSSCHPASKMVYCPGVTSILDAVVLTEFKPGSAPDPSNALYTVKIGDVTGVCDFDKKGEHSSSDIDITFTATRAQADDAAEYKVPYFVAITQADRVITKQQRSVVISFAAGEKSVTIDEPVKSIELKTDHDKKPWDYQILVGLQLTKEQLDYNRQVGIYSQ